MLPPWEGTVATTYNLTMKSGSSRRIANNLVALSSAAVLTVYSAGYLKTRAAAERLENAGHRDTADRPALRAPAPETGAPALASEIQPPPPVSPAPVAKAAEPKATASIAPAVRPEPKEKAPAAVMPPADAPAALATASASVTTPVETAAATAAVVPTPASATPPPTTPPPDVDPKVAEGAAPKPSPYKDGTYYGWGTSRHGSIQASVTIEGGKIVASSIAQCLTRYSCSWIAHLVPQVVARQSANVDYVSGATQSTYAFYDAVVEALSKAK